VYRKKESGHKDNGKKNAGTSGRMFPDISKVISVDSYILNYGTFLPGKLLGSTLNVGNNSSFEQIVELSIDAATINYNKKDLADKFDIAELPFPLDNPSDKKSQRTS
jgi:hypothetical protein